MRVRVVIEFSKRGRLTWFLGWMRISEMLGKGKRKRKRKRKREGSGRRESERDREGGKECYNKQYREGNTTARKEGRKEERKGGREGWDRSLSWRDVGCELRLLRRSLS